MTYEEFRIIVYKEIKRRFSSEADIKLGIVEKNNGCKYDCLTIEGMNNKITPVIYLKKYFNDYNMGKSLTDIITEISIHINKNINMNVSEQIIDWSSACSKVYPKIVNSEMNQEYLTRIPHTDMLDLSIVYYIRLDGYDYKHVTTIVKDEILKLWGITVEELHRQSMKNLNDNCDVSFQNIESALMECADKAGVDMDIDSNMLEKCSDVFVLTTSEGIGGASYMANDEVLRTISGILGCDLIILPSSINELIILRDDSFDITYLKAVVSEVNKTAVSPEEVLSDQVYLFHDGKLSIAGCAA
jgi:hypothetical protein